MSKYPAMVRKRIVELYDQGHTTKQIAGLFGVCRSGVRRVRQRLREHGTLTPPAAVVGRKPLLTGEVEARIRTHVAAHPDATREELKAALGLTVSCQSISRWLRRLKLPLKKSRSTPEQDRPDVALRRAVWHEELKGVDPAKLVFLDEAGSQTSMTRTRGRAPRGERLVAKVPCGTWKIVTMIGAVCTSGPFAAASLVGAVDTAAFVTYVREVLAPQLTPGFWAGLWQVSGTIHSDLLPRQRGCLGTFVSEYVAKAGPFAVLL